MVPKIYRDLSTLGDYLRRSDIFVLTYKILLNGGNIGSCNTAEPKLGLKIPPPCRLFRLHYVLGFVKLKPLLRQDR